MTGTQIWFESAHYPGAAASVRVGPDGLTSEQLCRELFMEPGTAAINVGSSTWYSLPPGRILINGVTPIEELEVRVARSQPSGISYADERIHHHSFLSAHRHVRWLQGGTPEEPHLMIGDDWFFLDHMECKFRVSTAFRLPCLETITSTTSVVFMPHGSDLDRFHGGRQASST